MFNSPEIWLFISTWAFDAACGILFIWFMVNEDDKRK